jgi:hypothetical protein
MRFKLSTLMRSDRKARASAEAETLVSRQRSRSDAASGLAQRTYPPIAVATRLGAGASQTLNEHWRVRSLAWKFLPEKRIREALPCPKRMLSE